MTLFAGVVGDFFFGPSTFAPQVITRFFTLVLFAAVWTEFSMLSQQGEMLAAPLANTVFNTFYSPAVAAIAVDRGCKVFCFTLGGGIVTGRQPEKLRILTAEVGQVAADVFAFTVGKPKGFRF